MKIQWLGTSPRESTRAPHSVPSLSELADELDEHGQELRRLVDTDASGCSLYMLVRRTGVRAARVCIWALNFYPSISLQMRYFFAIAHGELPHNATKSERNLLADCLDSAEWPGMELDYRGALTDESAFWFLRTVIQHFAPGIDPHSPSGVSQRWTFAPSTRRPEEVFTHAGSFSSWTVSPGLTPEADPEKYNEPKRFADLKCEVSDMAETCEVFAERLRAVEAATIEDTGGQMSAEPIDETLPEPVATSPSGTVKLFGQDDRPLVLGKTKEPLSCAAYNVVQTVLTRGETRLTEVLLMRRSGHGDARKILVNLCKNDADWAEVISPPGNSGKGYRIL